MAKSVKGTQTEKNLLTSFAGESQRSEEHTLNSSHSAVSRMPSSA